MFEKLLKNRQKETILDNNKNYPKEVLEIHNEFDTAAENLLRQANNIINSSPSVNESKINKLKELGFVQAKEVEDSKEILNNIKISKEQIELVNYYKKNYPFNKFITESQVKDICYKYNLVCGDVDRFKGFVPEKNMNDIISFKLKDKDIIYGYCFANGEPMLPEDVSLRYNYTLEDILRRMESFSEKVKPMYSKFKICAPVKDMDISGLELLEGYKLEKKHIPDPVVLQPIKGGYLIITAWGDEASDPLVVNEINN